MGDTEKVATKKAAEPTIEDSGFNYNDPVTVDWLGEKETKGHIYGIHAGGKKVDVRIAHPGHKEHGRVVTFQTDDVEAGHPEE